MSAQPSVAVRFMLDADADPGLLPRLLQPFARRDLVPDRMWSHRAGDTMGAVKAYQQYLNAYPDAPDAARVRKGIQILLEKSGNALEKP